MDAAREMKASIVLIPPWTTAGPILVKASIILSKSVYNPNIVKVFSYSVGNVLVHQKVYNMIIIISNTLDFCKRKVGLSLY